ncbi:MAG: hypothetical protein M3Y17_13430 [Actinomycetota bacterium]|nr:hypothetical protein [Actinomycetota bacterium]
MTVYVRRGSSLRTGAEPRGEARGAGTATLRQAPEAGRGALEDGLCGLELPHPEHTISMARIPSRRRTVRRIADRAHTAPR